MKSELGRLKTKFHQFIRDKVKGMGTRFLENIIKLKSQSINYLIIYILALYYYLFAYNKSKNDVYVPKSQRDLTYKLKRAIICNSAKLAKKISNGIETLLQGGDSTFRRRYLRRTTSRQYGRRPRFKKRNGSNLKKLIVVMSTTSGRQTKSRERLVHFDTDSGPVGIDNRCSACMSPYLEDFVGPMETCERSIKGFNGTSTHSVKKGTLLWRWEDDNGVVHKFKIPGSYYIPGLETRLLSPQHWAKAQRVERRGEIGCETSAYSTKLFWGNKKFLLTVPHSDQDNCATFALAPGYKQFSVYCARMSKRQPHNDDNPLICEEIKFKNMNIEKFENTAQADFSSLREGPILFDMDAAKIANGPNANDPVTFHNDPPNMENDEAALLRYHQRFNHISFDRLRLMAKQNIIPKRLCKARIPVCSACAYAKSTRRPWRNKSPKTAFKMNEVSKVGERVHVDQMESSTPGFIAQMVGSLTTKRYKYATIFVDAYSKFGYVHLQKTATVEETIEAKRAFELYARTKGVTIEAYHADNGIFKAHKWMEECNRSKQPCTFAPVGAHHNNGIAEKRIRDLQDLARTMMIHAASRWPQAITANLWPYALRMANEVVNDTSRVADRQGRSSSQIFSNTKVNINSKHYAPFGCPVFVLNSALQKEGGIYHKWDARTRVGIYLGHSPLHSRHVALVLDRYTGLVSPQFHVKLDPQFDTVDQVKFDSAWQLKAGFVPQREISPKTIETSEGGTNPQPKRKREITQSEKEPTKRTRFEIDSKAGSKLGGSSQAHLPPNTLRGPGPEGQDDHKSCATTDEGMAIPMSKSSEMEPLQHIEGVEGDKSPDSTQNTPPLLIQERLMSICRAEMKTTPIEGELFCLESLYPQRVAVENDERQLLAYKATIDPDTMYLHEAMRESDWEEFRKAMQDEINDRIKGKNFSIIPRSSVPLNMKVLPAVWQLKRKRDIVTKKIKKYKARLNLDGSRMKKGEHYDESYAPVASWNSIRILLALAITNNWHTRQLDYVAAFPQAPVERELYMEIPKGVHVEGLKESSKDYVLQIHKNLYGQKQAGRVWNQYLVQKLKKIGFKQSKVDECVFFRGRSLYVLYTDDSLLAGPDPKELDKITRDMEKVGLEITVDGNIEDFLGVNISKQEDGTTHLWQPQLIDSILKDLRLDGETVKTKETPAASSTILKRHQEMETVKPDFNYRSIIGKLNYLERGSRSDIAYIVHQLARFSVEPKRPHVEAVRWLGRYLRGTRDKGTILKPDKSRGLEVYVDADFAGNFDKDDNSRDTARSRHGYYIMLNGCPISWKSQLQTEIALSSTESEYTGLSYALREVIPIIELMKELRKGGFDVNDAVPVVKCKVFEDNSGALEIAMNHKYRPRTKHMNNKLHHFRDYISRKEIEVLRINTLEQIADILTKPVNGEILKKLRKRAIGW